MPNYERILVALDLSDKDGQLLQFAGYLAKFYGTKKAYFVHIIPDFESPTGSVKALSQFFPGDSPIDEKIKSHIENKVAAQIDRDKELAVDVEVIEGKPYQKLLHWLEVKYIDLLVVGTKTKSEGSGITPKRVARKADTDIFFVGEKPVLPVKKILVPIDFSENSAKALQSAMTYKAKDPAVEITAIHVMVTVTIAPIVGIVYTTQNLLVLEQRVNKAFQHFLEDYQINKSMLHFDNIVSENTNVGRTLAEYAKEEKFDLIIMGAKGHSALDGILLGSVTENLVDYNQEVPVLIVRQDNEITN